MQCDPAIHALGEAIKEANRAKRITFAGGDEFYFGHMLRAVRRFFTGSLNLASDVAVSAVDVPSPRAWSESGTVVYVARIVKAPPLSTTVQCFRRAHRVAICTEHDMYILDSGVEMADVALHFSPSLGRDLASTSAGARFAPFTWFPFTSYTDECIDNPWTTPDPQLRRAIFCRILTPRRAVEGLRALQNEVAHTKPFRSSRSNALLAFGIRRHRRHRYTGSVLALMPQNTPRRAAIAHRVYQVCGGDKTRFMLLETPRRWDAIHPVLASAATLLINVHAWHALDYSGHCCHCGHVRSSRVGSTKCRSSSHRYTCEACSSVDYVADYARLTQEQRDRMLCGPPSPRVLETSRLGDFSLYRTPFLSERPADEAELLRQLRIKGLAHEACALEKCFVSVSELPLRVSTLVQSERRLREHAFISAVAYRGLVALANARADEIAEQLVAAT